MMRTRTRALLLALAMRRGRVVQEAQGITAEKQGADSSSGTALPTGSTGAAITQRRRTPDERKRFALLIAVDRYNKSANNGPEFERLEYCSDSVTALHTVLKNLDYDVNVLIDARHTVIREKISIFCQNKPPNSFVWIHFSGHGTRMDVDDDVELHARDSHRYLDKITKKSLETILYNSKARRRFISIDTCYSGSRHRISLPSLPKNLLDLSRQKISDMDLEGHLVLSACGAKEATYHEPEFKRTRFLHAMIDGLTKTEGFPWARALGGKKVLTVQNLYIYVAHQVSRLAKKKSGSPPYQLPCLEGVGPSMIIAEQTK